LLASLLSAFKVADIRKRILFVFAGFAIFIYTIHLTVPGVNLDVWERLLRAGALFRFLGMFTGGALNKFSITAMGITPYINASIIMQLLTIVIPQLEQLAKEGGEEGRRKISTYTRILTIVLAMFQATTMVLGLAHYRGEGGETIFHYTGPLYYLLVIVSLTAGTAFLMWLGEQITDKGIGNGVSMIIFAGIVLRYPDYVIRTLGLVRGGELRLINLILFAIIAIFLIMAIVMIQQGQRRVPVQYAKRVVGRRVMGGQSTYIPIRVNNAGVISIIFAISVLYFPITIAGFVKDAPWVNVLMKYFSPGSFIYSLVYFLLVVFFTFFYSAVTFNIMDIADNMKKYGGFIPGIRPGPKTADYLNRILSRITFISAIFLGLIAVLPNYVMGLTHVTTFYLGSTSLLIVVGVALEFMQQIEARLVMRHYQGFMK